MILPIGDNSYMFWCPGCESIHVVDSRWIVSDEETAPTVTPSMHVQDARGRVCHLLLTQGQLIYLNDCHHALQGQTVPLPDFPAWMTSR